MSPYRFKKEHENNLNNQGEPEGSINSNNEKLPEFDVNGTALNDLHSLFED